MILNKKIINSFTITKLVLLSLLLNNPLSAQSELEETDTTENYFDENYLRTADHIYDSAIRTILFFKKGWELSAPRLSLQDRSVLELRFDDLEQENRNILYKIIHCDADWNLSDISEFEYIDGFLESPIIEYEYSFNTQIPFVNYRLEIPNEDVKIIKSGNYLLKVYEDEEENLLFTRRFVVYEDLLKITAQIKRSSIVQNMSYDQEVSFKINHSQFPIENPFARIKVVVQQNDRWDNSISNLQPVFIRNNELIYQNSSSATFPGNNEFRYFDCKSISFITPMVQNIYLDSIYKMQLKPFEKRSYSNYSFYSDINGQRLIKNDRGTNSHIDADYIWTSFSLPLDFPLKNGNVYLFGTLSNLSVEQNKRMRYNNETHSYELSLFLKQGYYNYAYAFVEDGSHVAKLKTLEGSHWQTENDYTILVYYKDFTSGIDRLIGVKTFNSRKDDK